MVPISNTSCSYRSISSYNYKVKNMAKLNPKAQAVEIIGDHYAYLNQTYGGNYADAVKAAEVSVEKVIEALQDICSNDKQRKAIDQWREVLQCVRDEQQ
jgi:hypothetical protein